MEWSPNLLSIDEESEVQLPHIPIIIAERVSMLLC